MTKLWGSEIFNMAHSAYTIMGIINLTPDSFSDGGSYRDSGEAFERLLRYLDEGADIVDIGAESTRPQAQPISSTEEWRRLKPLLDRIANASTPIPFSVDTYKPATMQRLLDYQPTMLNDTKSQAPHKLLEQLANRGIAYLAMHMHGEPSTMQDNPLQATTVMTTLLNFFKQRISVLRNCGFADTQIWIDPGIGFGKSDHATMHIFRNLHQLAAIAPVAVGVSRKSWLGRYFQIDPPHARDDISSMLALALIWQGARLIRTHDVATLHRLKRLF
ncbi:MAG: dihydropteroate synthase [Pseudomonadota bacterium]|nr:dihydropteroate synthase [Pseudomonadota bacterium]